MIQPTAAYAFSLPLPAEGYVRTFQAEIDNLRDSTVRVRGTLSDSRCTLEYDWVVRIPDYEILHASARYLSGDPQVLSPELLSRSCAIQGTRTSQGFATSMRGLLGDLPGHQEHLALATEMARVSLQAYPVPKGDHERFVSFVTDMPPGPSRLARMLWERDRAEWGMVSNSCYTYRDESGPLFETRTVVAFDPDSVSPEPGQKRFFWRTKRLHIVQCESVSGFQCKNEMDDPFQQMQIAFDIAADGTICNATSQAGRLPYQGLCEAPQRRTAGLNGLTLSKKFSRLIADQVGGSTGCSHLFDLATDCLRLFTWRD
jgi:hypothetical protein